MGYPERDAYAVLRVFQQTLLDRDVLSPADIASVVSHLGVPVPGTFGQLDVSMSTEARSVSLLLIEGAFENGSYDHDSRPWFGASEYVEEFTMSGQFLLMITDESFGLALSPAFELIDPTGVPSVPLSAQGSSGMGGAGVLIPVGEHRYSLPSGQETSSQRPLVNYWLRSG